MKSFGVTPALETAGMTACIRGFIKYQTCSAVSAFQETGRPMPAVGHFPAVPGPVFPLQAVLIVFKH